MIARLMYRTSTSGATSRTTSSPSTATTVAYMPAVVRTRAPGRRVFCCMAAFFWRFRPGRMAMK